MNTQELKKYINRVLGNKIRCLLPSFWWKRLFNLVVDRVDEVEQNSKIPIVTSENELNKLNLPEGSLASVSGVKKMKFSECYQLSSTDNDIELEDLAKKLTIVKEIGVNFPLPTFTTEHNATYRIYNLNGNQISGGVFILIDGVDYKVVYTNEADSESEEFLIKSQSDIDRINDILGSGDFYYIGLENNGLESENVKIIDTAFYVVSDSISVTAYIKGDSWERLAKESDINDATIFIGEESQRNADAFNKIFANTYCSTVVVKDGLSFPAVASFTIEGDSGLGVAEFFDMTGENVLRSKVLLSLFRGLGSAQIVHSGEIGGSSGGTTIREFYIGDSLTDEQKAWNLETAQAILDKKAIVICNGSILGDAITTNNDGSKEFINSTPTSQGVLYAGVKVEEDGTASVFFRQLYLDDKLSDKSIDAVQNKVITAALNNKADKTYVDNAVANVTVDTSGLATKEELNNAIATSITNILNTEV